MASILEVDDCKGQTFIQVSFSLTIYSWSSCYQVIDVSNILLCYVYCSLNQLLGEENQMSPVGLLIISYNEAAEFVTGITVPSH